MYKWYILRCRRKKHHLAQFWQVDPVNLIIKIMKALNAFSPFSILLYLVSIMTGRRSSSSSRSSSTNGDAVSVATHWEGYAK